ncbi:MAG: hypothetical protein AAB728_04925 [Patescibacteria group bacterium]
MTKPPPHHHRLLLFLAIAGIALLILRERSLQTSHPLQVSFLPVPQGSATLIATPAGKTVLIGGGKDLTAFREMGKLLPFFARTVDLLVLADHRHVSTETLDETARRYRIRRALLPSPLPETLSLHRTILEEHKVPITDVPWDKTVPLEDALTLTITNDGKSKPAQLTLASGRDRIDLPGLKDDIAADFPASLLRAIVWEDGQPQTVVVRDPKFEAWTEDIPLRNLATEGAVTVSLNGRSVMVSSVEP